ncbi:hypothetical protein [Streptomyces thermolilacinus]|uniref:hypothetical protein n=1 Tax=Streptomyces thermolilacinus TaxID=285540 RepID=UPI003F4CDCB9
MAAWPHAHADRWGRRPRDREGAGRKKVRDTVFAAVVPGRTTLLRSGVHLLLFDAFVLLSFSP